MLSHASLTLTIHPLATTIPPDAHLGQASKGTETSRPVTIRHVLPSKPQKMNESGGRSRDRTCDFVRVNGADGCATSTIAHRCNAEGDASPDRDVPCFPLSPDDSSRIVTKTRAKCTEAPTTSEGALRLAIKLAVDAGEYERAATLIDVAKRSPKPATVTLIGEGRGRNPTC